MSAVRNLSRDVEGSFSHLFHEEKEEDQCNRIDDGGPIHDPRPSLAIPNELDEIQYEKPKRAA